MLRGAKRHKANNNITSNQILFSKSIYSNKIRHQEVYFFQNLLLIGCFSTLIFPPGIHTLRDIHFGTRSPMERPGNNHHHMSRPFRSFQPATTNQPLLAIFCTRSTEVKRTQRSGLFCQYSIIAFALLSSNSVELFANSMNANLTPQLQKGSLFPNLFVTSWTATLAARWISPARVFKELTETSTPPAPPPHVPLQWYGSGQPGFVQVMISPCSPPPP